MNGESRLAKLADTITTKAPPSPKGQSVESPALQALVNGHANEMVYRLLPRKDRRADGVFFSGSDWARTLVGQMRLEDWSRFLDPSAGTGDLLLEVCKQLPLEATASKTIAVWANRLSAIDLRESFLRIAWARIQALAMSRHNEPVDLSRFKPLPLGFRAGNVLTSALDLRANDCVFMNPPYQRALAPAKSFVGNGMRSAAALHVEHVVLSAPQNVGIVALVPDVLRSGSSYKCFREGVSDHVEIQSFDGYGSFGAGADVDVAILRGVTRALRAKRPASPSLTPADISHGTVGSHYTISVGPVVPHRTREDGTQRGYLTAKNLPIWGSTEVPAEMATYVARLHHGPFVAVRRTSSPTDKQRARATLIRGKGPWLVENHLIIVKPNSGTLKDCKKAIENFKDPRTDSWLNMHIRCRHLTVGAIASIPIWINEQT